MSLLLVLFNSIFQENATASNTTARPFRTVPNIGEKNLVEKQAQTISNVASITEIVESYKSSAVDATAKSFRSAPNVRELIIVQPLG